jgi:hypothetical protein
MKLCIGATSRRVVEEAARCRVHQIVASRSQVEGSYGYSGFTPESLVATVKKFSDGETEVVRDHGGPNQGGKQDYLEALHADVAAGFDGLHLDVCKVPYEDQEGVLKHMLHEFAGAGVHLEVGGEHEPNEWNYQLLETTLAEGITPEYVVAGFGSHVWMDRQCGRPVTPSHLKQITLRNSRHNVSTKIHNADWIGQRVARYGDTVHAYNLAPELGCLEVDLLLSQLNGNASDDLLHYAYDSKKWRRWFSDEREEGTWFDRAKCALRYLLEDDYVADISQEFMPSDGEDFIRKQIRLHIERG